MAEDVENIEEEASESDFLSTIEVCGGLLCKLEESGLNMLPQQKIDLQMKLIKIINQSLDFIDYEQEE